MTHLTFKNKTVIRVTVASLKSRSSNFCIFIHLPVMFYLFGQKNLIITPLSNIPMMRQTKFHTHTEKHTKLQCCFFPNLYAFRWQTKTKPAEAYNKYGQKITTNYVTQKYDWFRPTQIRYALFVGLITAINVNSLCAATGKYCLYSIKSIWQNPFVVNINIFKAGSQVKSFTCECKCWLK